MPQGNLGVWSEYEGVMRAPLYFEKHPCVALKELGVFLGGAL